MTDALDRVEAAEAGPGEIAAVAGMAEITIGETLADPDDPRPLPVITVDEPSLSMTIGINTSPLAGIGRAEGHGSTDPQPARGRTGGQRRPCGSARPSDPTPGRSRVVASCSWPCSSRPCAARGSSSRWASPRS